MIAVDEYIVCNWDVDQYESFGIHHKVHIYKHFHNPLITIFDRGAMCYVITFQLEEFESLVTLDKMLPIFARDVYSYIDDALF